jgi:histidine triad (HIT) family protein
MTDCIFCKIVEGSIPSRKVYEDDEVLAFHDIRPVAPVHFMIIPKRHIDSLATATPGDAPVLGRMMAVAGRLAREQGATDGFRTIVNTGRVGRQDVYHLHIHIIGGPDVLPFMLAKDHGRT